MAELFKLLPCLRGGGPPALSPVAVWWRGEKMTKEIILRFTRTLCFPHGFFNLVQDSICTVEHLLIFKADDADAMHSCQVFSADFIVACPIKGIVPCSVQLYTEFNLGRVEVKYVWPNRELASKFYSENLSSFQHFPQGGFCWCSFLTQTSPIFFHCRPVVFLRIRTRLWVIHIYSYFLFIALAFYSPPHRSPILIRGGGHSP